MIRYACWLFGVTALAGMSVGFAQCSAFQKTEVLDGFGECTALMSITNSSHPSVMLLWLPNTREAIGALALDTAGSASILQLSTSAGCAATLIPSTLSTRLWTGGVDAIPRCNALRAPSKVHSALIEIAQSLAASDRPFTELAFIESTDGQFAVVASEAGGRALAVLPNGRMHSLTAFELLETPLDASAFAVLNTSETVVTGVGKVGIVFKDGSGYRLRTHDGKVLTQARSAKLAADIYQEIVREASGLDIANADAWVQFVSYAATSESVWSTTRRLPVSPVIAAFFGAP